MRVCGHRHMLDVEELLRPVSPESYCGRNMEYEASFLSLTELARAQPEIVIGNVVKPAQEPDWSQVLDGVRELFALTKDLRLAGILHLAYVKTSGIQGLEGGLRLVRGLLELCWDCVHPLIDTEDGDDPTFRVNALVTGIASDEVLEAIRRSALVTSRQHGVQTLRDYRIASGVIKPTDEGVDRDQVRARVDAAFSETSIDTLQQIVGWLSGAAEHVEAIQALLAERAGGVPQEVASLSADIFDMRKLLNAHLPHRVERPPPLSVVERQESTVLRGGDAILGRADVIEALEKICTYYKNAEPSSPVPLLLRRAQRLVDKDFMDIIRDLTPAAISEVAIIAGTERKDG